MDEVVQPIISPQAETPPARKINIRKILDNSSWIALFTLTPLFFIAFLSQNSLPGDFLYPVKRGVENTILAAASVSPASKAAFHTDLADRRFTEAEKLLLSQADTAPLNDLVTQVESTQVAIDNVSDPVKKVELEEKVIAQIDTYQAKLTNTQIQIQPNYVPPSPTPSVEQAPEIPSSEPSSVPVVVIPTQQVATPTPTSAPIPVVTSAPVVVPTQPDEQKVIAIEDTKRKLEKVKKDLQEQSKHGKEVNRNNNSSR